MEIAEHLNRAGAAPPRADTRFRKGQSGNPRGRPRKVMPVDDPQPRYAEASLYEMVRGEAYRPVRVRSGDRSVEMSAIRAGLREMSLKAAKGNRLALSALMQLMLQTEAAEARRAEASPAHTTAWRPQPAPEIAAAEEYKEVWSRVLVDAAHTGATLDSPVPHPDEVTIGRVGGTVSWSGSAPGETLSLDGLAATCAELVASLPEQRREIDALPDGYEKVVALCGWFDRGDLCAAIARNLPERYPMGPIPDWRVKEADRRTREWAEQQRRDFEWAAARKLEEAERPDVEAEADTMAAADPGAAEAVAEARTYVRAWNAALRKAEEVGLSSPGPTLHPDDVLIDEGAGTVGYRKRPAGDGAATIAQAREGLAQLRRTVRQYAQDMAWADEAEMPLVLRKIDGAKQVCAAMAAVLEGESG